MKNNVLKIVLPITTLAIIGASTAHAGLSIFEDSNIYLAAEGGASSIDLDNSGYSDIGVNYSTGSDDEMAALLGIKLGLDFSRFRFDIGYRYYSETDFETYNYGINPVPNSRPAFI